MTYRAALGIALLVMAPQGLSASAPTTSLLPEMRPGTAAASARVETGPAGPGLPGSLFPKPRPEAPVVEAKPAPAPEPEPEPEQAVAIPASAGGGVVISQRPGKRPKVTKRILRQLARAEDRAARESRSAAPVRGSVCGDRAIRGKPIASIPGKLRGCGVANPVQVTAVDGVALSTPSNINCDTAKALRSWVSQSVKPAVGKRGGGVASLRVVAHYSCRTRNNRPGAKISEHGRGNAIDIAAITLRDGSSLDVLTGWRTKSQGPILKRVFREACGTFGTALGPDGDRYHQDHFHFDVARHRSGAYCR